LQKQEITLFIQNREEKPPHTFYISYGGKLRTRCNIHWAHSLLQNKEAKRNQAVGPGAGNAAHRRNILSFISCTDFCPHLKGTRGKGCILIWWAMNPKRG
jgi:hypothetical protein